MQCKKKIEDIRETCVFDKIVSVQKTLSPVQNIKRFFVDTSVLDSLTHRLSPFGAGDVLVWVAVMGELDPLFDEDGEDRRYHYITNQSTYALWIALQVGSPGVGRDGALYTTLRILEVDRAFQHRPDRTRVKYKLLEEEDYLLQSVFRKNIDVQEVTAGAEVRYTVTHDVLQVLFHEMQPEADAKDYLDDGIKAMGKGQFCLASERFEQAMACSKRPETISEVRFNKACLFTKQKLFQEAVNELQLLQTNDPNDPGLKKVRTDVDLKPLAGFPPAAQFFQVQLKRKRKWRVRRNTSDVDRAKPPQPKPTP
uniref:Uncharacterized protein n=1 Tax=Eutreptiella gymnastica TaxID=73025 RepID=A0A7S1NWB2_9EUGL